MEGPPPAPRRLLALAPFPRVFAAGAVPADSEADGKSQKLPYFVPESCFSESGWDRLRQLFVKDEQESYPKELMNIYRSALSAGILGWAYGGIPAFIHAKRRYIEQSQAENFHNRFDAVQCAHRAATRGFLRYGWRWSWRTAAFVAVFNSVNTGLTAYRNKNALSHFVVAGAVTGSLFRINLGLRGLVAGGIIGALLGTPMGSLWMVLQKYCGETVQEMKQKDQQAQQEQKLAEWRARLQFTELLPEDIESRLQKNQSQDDAKKIKALLSLPRNPSSPDKQGED